MNESLTVLVADDLPENRALVIAVLGWRGYRMLEAGNGREALDIIEREHVDLVITDLLMPEMDGFELARRLAEMPGASRRRILFYSANYNVQEAMRLGLQCGVVGVIAKPAEPQAILDAVDAALRAPVPELPAGPDTFERDHARIVANRTAEALLEKRAATDRLRRLQGFGAELLGAADGGAAARALCVAAREMALATDAAVGLYPTLDDPYGVVVRGVLGGALFQRSGFATPADEPPQAVEGAPALAIGAALGLRYESGADALALPLDTPSRRHGWLCVTGKIGGASFTVEDGEALAALVAQAAIACENSYRLAEMSARTRKLSEEVVERQHAEASLREAQMVTRFALGAANAMVWEIDLKSGAISYASSETTTPGSIWSDSMRPATRDELFELILPEDRPAFLHALQTDIPAGRQVTVECRIAQPDSTVRWTETKAQGLMHTGGSPVKVIGITSDVTARKVLEMQLRGSQKMEAVGMLAGGIAHDFNNMLTAIVGYSELLSDTLEHDQQREEVGEIRKAADRAAVLTRQLLAFSRRQVLRPEPMDLGRLIDNLAPMLRRLIGEDVRLETTIKGPLSRVSIDAGQFEQVVMNLVVNARDAMPGGGRISINLAGEEIDEEYCAEHPGSAPGPHVVLAIRDTGQGMDRDTLKRIFEPFFTTKPLGKGTGLGLSTVFGIVKQSGGSIWVYSEPGQGTVFKVYVPAHQQAGSDRAETSPAVRPALRGGSETILLAEDEPSVRAFATRALERLGYRVIAAADSAAAIDAARQTPGIDILVTDVVMPDRSGPELYALLSETRPSLKVLYTSGYPGDDIVRRGFRPEDAFLQKPFTTETLGGQVRSVLDGGVA